MPEEKAPPPKPPEPAPAPLKIKEPAGNLRKREDWFRKRTEG